nr:choice-of-anchor D domain-containing protein [Prolixibacteraceae bacterium]
MKLFLTSLALFFFMINSISVLAYNDNTDQKVSFSKRSFSEQELDELKAKIGVAQEGVNYNVKINGFGTGLIPPTEEQWAKMKAQAVFVDKMTFADASAPVSHDNSATIWFPPIGNQAAEGSCVGWATGYYNKTFQEAREHNWDLSGCTWENGWEGYPSPAYQDKIFSPDFIYHQINGGTDGGSTYGDALNLLYRIGCCTWDKMPYDMYNSTDWPSEDAWRQAPVYCSATPYNYAGVTDDTDINNLKQFLANYNNAIISINGNYYDALTLDDLWTSDSYTATSTNHANLIVGYDDNFGPYTEGGTTKYGAFKVANSWGIDNWENDADGFYWISYECMKENISDYMFYENLVGYEPEMISVFSMDHDLRGECQVSVGMGSSSSPAATKRFDDYYYNGGNHAYPANMMVMDITEFGTPADAENFYIQVYDGETSVVGQINSFSIEMYDDYASGTPTATYLSSETPVSTVAGIDVLAQLQTTDDPTPPATISDLQVTSTASYAVTLGWTASGDDGTTGTAAGYDIRYSQSIIDQTNFDAATQVTNPPDPSAAGTIESFTVGGLNNNTTYYFAIKTIDDRTNESGVSNSPSGTTLGAPQIDVTPTSLSASLQAGASTTQSFTISNTGEGLLEFAIPYLELTPQERATVVNYPSGEKNIGFYADENRVGSSKKLPGKMPTTLADAQNIYQLLGEGGDVVETYQNFPVEVGGIEWVDGDVIAVGISSDIYSYNLENELYSTIFTVDIGTPYQCSWDGEYLWISNNSGNVYGYDLSGNLVGSFSTPVSNFVALTFDGENFLVSQAWQTDPVVYKLDYQGNVLGTYNFNNYAGDISALVWVPQHHNGNMWALGYMSGNYNLSQLSFNGSEFNYVDGFIFNDNDDAYSIAHDGRDMLFSDWDGPLFKLDDGNPEGSWLTLNEITNFVAAGSPLTVEATFNATELNDGNYETMVQVNSNDPVNPIVEIPVSLQVNGIPDISLSTSAIDFGDVYQDFEDTQNLQIINTGTKNLSIASIGSDNNIFTTNLNNTAIINPGDSLQLVVYATASSTGTHNGTLTIVSNDPDTPSTTVALTANCVESPVMAISPDSIEVTLQTGETTTETLTISNTGESELTFSFPDYIESGQLTAASTANTSPVYSYMEIAKGANDPRVGEQVVGASGGSDAYGYSWVDSNDPNGPVFNWTDILGTGTPVTGLGDDNYVGSFPIGFNFPFYENTYSQFYITSNGLIMFGNPSSSLSNQPIPVAEEPNDFIAWCWDDLYSRGTVHYQNANDQLVIQFTGYGEYGNTSTSITAQVILSLSGKIKIQYLNTTGGFNTTGCTVGIENAAGDDGLQVAFNTGYIEDNLALEFSSVVDWITVIPATGTLAPGATTDVEVGIDATGMTYGRRVRNLNINSNDPSKLSYNYQVAVNIPASQELIDDSLALVAFYNAGNGDNWNDNTGWLTGPLYNWFGISISEGQITKLELPVNNLNGYIPNEIGELTNLTVLNLRQNSGLSGTSIPDSVGSLENLIELDLYNNGHSGSIPESIGNLSALEYLDLAANWNLTGSIPSSIGDMANLRNLNLRGNNLTGNIPAEIGNLTDLNYLYLYDNQLSGSIPLEIGDASNLRYIRLQNNQLTGTIPEEMGNLNLWALYLDNNQLEGEIPASFENVNFGFLHLHNNNLSGDLPSSLAQMVNNPVSIPEEEKVANESQPLYLRDGSLASSVQKDASLNVSYRLRVENNKFTFANLETSGIAPGSIDEFTYAPLDTVLDLDFNESINALTVHDGKASENNNLWYYNFETIAGETNDSIFNIEDTGGYGCIVSNIVYPDLELTSEIYGTIENPQLEADSLALVALYNATGGANWNNNENWLTGPIDTWYGVTVSKWRVSQLEMSDNNL